MKSICLFSSYFEGNSLPYYVRFYLENLKPFFSEIVFLTNEKVPDNETVNYFTNNNISVQYFVNEGMDFGMWSKMIGKIEIENYDRIALINDSCILVKSPKDFFKWDKLNELDFAGMLLSGKFTDHLQSYFIVLNKRAIPLAKKFLGDTGILGSYKEIIFQQEIGLSTFMKSNGMRIGGFYDFSHRKDVNPSFILIDELIEMGCPFIKKKVFTRNFSWGDYLTWFRNKYEFSPVGYIQRIREINKGEKLIDFDKVISELNGRITFAQNMKYKGGQVAYNVLSKIPPLRYLFHKLISVKRSVENGER